MSPSADGLTPTAAQLRYLRALAEQTASTFVSPRSREQASREIGRLRRLKDEAPASRSEEREGDREAEADEQQLVYATALQPGEASGFNSTASWRTSPAPVSQPPARQGGVGVRTELARYHVKSGERVLYGQRVDGCVRITDRPVSGGGRCYLVERKLEQDGYAALQALVADYLEQSRELDEIPMASSVINRAQLEERGCGE